MDDQQPPAAAVQKAKRGDKGLPPHVSESKLANGVIKFQARLRWLPQGEVKKRYDFIPGLNGTTYFDTSDQAAAAQAAAVQVIATGGGPEAVWPKGLPGSKGPNRKRDVAYYEEVAAAKAQREAAKAAAKAAREAAEAARPKRPRKEKLEPCSSTAMPSNRDEVTVECTRNFLVDPPQREVGTPRPPVPVPAGLEAV